MENEITEQRDDILKQHENMWIKQSDYPIIQTFALGAMNQQSKWVNQACTGGIKELVLFGDGANETCQIVVKTDGYYAYTGLKHRMIKAHFHAPEFPEFNADHCLIISPIYSIVANSAAITGFLEAIMQTDTTCSNIVSELLRSIGINHMFNEEDYFSTVVYSTTGTTMWMKEYDFEDICNVHNQRKVIYTANSQDALLNKFALFEFGDKDFQFHMRFKKGVNPLRELIVTSNLPISGKHYDFMK